MNGMQVINGSVRHAIELAGRAPSIHNTQPWMFVVSEQAIELYADEKRWLAVTDADKRDLLLSCGAALHHLRIGLAAGGIGASVQRMPDAARPDLLASVALDGQADAVDASLSAEIPRRRTDRRPFRNYPMPEAFLGELCERAAEQGGLLRVVDDAGARASLVAAFVEAADLQRRQPGYAEELDAWTHREGRDGIPPRNVPRPPPPAVEVARDFDGRPRPAGQPEPEAATLLVLGTASDDPLSQLRAGEAMSAVLLQATRHRLGTCPLSQPLEIGETRNMLRDRVLGGTLSPQLVIRLGWPQTDPVSPMPRRLTEELIRQPSR
jgi:nitroreductase